MAEKWLHATIRQTPRHKFNKIKLTKGCGMSRNARSKMFTVLHITMTDWNNELDQTIYMKIPTHLEKILKIIVGLKKQAWDNVNWLKKSNKLDHALKMCVVKPLNSSYYLHEAADYGSLSTSLILFWFCIIWIYLTRWIKTNSSFWNKGTCRDFKLPWRWVSKRKIRKWFEAYRATTTSN